MSDLFTFVYIYVKVNLWRYTYYIWIWNKHTFVLPSILCWLCDFKYPFWRFTDIVYTDSLAVYSIYIHKNCSILIGFYCIFTWSNYITIITGSHSKWEEYGRDSLIGFLVTVYQSKPMVESLVHLYTSLVYQRMLSFTAMATVVQAANNNPKTTNLIKRDAYIILLTCS